MSGRKKSGMGISHWNLTPRDLIEQAIARGQSLDWIIDNLDVTSQDVDKVLQRMDVLAGHRDRVPRVVHKPAPTSEKMMSAPRKVLVTPTGTTCRKTQSKAPTGGMGRCP